MGSDSWRWTKLIVSGTGITLEDNSKANRGTKLNPVRSVSRSRRTGYFHFCFPLFISVSGVMTSGQTTETSISSENAFQVLVSLGESVSGAMGNLFKHISPTIKMVSFQSLITCFHRSFQICKFDEGYYISRPLPTYVK